MKPVLVLLLVAVFAGLGWLAVSGGPGPADLPDAPAAVETPAEPPAAPEPVRGEKDGPARVEVEEEPVSFTTAADGSPRAARRTGSLELRVRWGEDDTPAADVQVLVLFDTTFTHDYRHSRWVRTDEQGVAVCADVPAGRVTLQADRGAVRSFVLPAGAHARVTLRLHAGVSVRGVVLDANGQAAPGATVRLAANPSWPGAGTDVTHSAADGSFVVRGVRPPAWLCAVAPGRVASELQAVLGRTKKPIELRLGGPAPVLRGAVTGPYGGPVEGAVVVLAQTPDPDKPATLKRRRMPVVLRTDGNGSFADDTLDPEMGVTVWARAEGAALGRERLRFDGRHTAFASVRLQRGATVVGRLHDEQGRQARLQRVSATLQDVLPARDEALPFDDWLRPVAVCDNLGDYVLPCLAPGRVTLAIGERGGAAFATETFELADGETRRWDVRLARKGALRGTLVDGYGRPLAAWTLHARVPDAEVLPKKTTTDPDGRFEFAHCDAAKYRIDVAAPPPAAAGDVHRFHDVAVGLEQRLVVPLEAVPAAAVVGRLRVPDGVDATHLTLTVEAGDLDGTVFHSQPVPADAAGRFRIDRLRAGRHELSVAFRDPAWAEMTKQKDNRTLTLPQARTGQPAPKPSKRPPIADQRLADFTLRAGEVHDLGELVLAANGTLQLKVRDAHGKAPERGTVAVFRGELERFASSGLHNGNGSVQLPPGDYTVVVATAGLFGQGRATVAGGRSEVLELQLQAAAACEVRYPESTPMYTTWFESWHDGAGRLVLHERAARKDARGAPRFTRELPPGRYRVVVRDFAGASAETEVEVVAGTSNPVLVNLPARR